MHIAQWSYCAFALRVQKQEKVGTCAELCSPLPHTFTMNFDNIKQVSNESLNHDSAEKNRHRSSLWAHVSIQSKASYFYKMEEVEQRHTEGIKIKMAP